MFGMLAIRVTLNCGKVRSKDELEKLPKAVILLKQRLKTLKLFSIFGRLLRADLIKCWTIFHFEVDIGLLDEFTLTVDQRIRGHLFKGVVPRCELERGDAFLFKDCSAVELIIRVCCFSTCIFFF